jgi:hypothetical protein
MEEDFDPSLRVAPGRIRCPTCARVLEMASQDQVFTHEEICPSSRLDGATAQGPAQPAR